MGGKPRHNVQVSGPSHPYRVAAASLSKTQSTHPDVGLMNPYRVQRGHVGLKNLPICHRQSSFDGKGKKYRGMTIKFSGARCFWREVAITCLCISTRMIPYHRKYSESEPELALRSNSHGRAAEARSPAPGPASRSRIKGQNPGTLKPK